MLLNYYLIINTEYDKSFFSHNLFACCFSPVSYNSLLMPLNLDVSKSKAPEKKNGELSKNFSWIKPKKTLRFLSNRVRQITFITKLSPVNEVGIFISFFFLLLSPPIRRDRKKFRFIEMFQSGLVESHIVTYSGAWKTQNHDGRASRDIEEFDLLRSTREEIVFL